MEIVYDGRSKRYMSEGPEKFGNKTMIYVFGHCKLDTSVYTLYRPDVSPIRLRPKVFQVLLYLIEHRDRVVSKDELLDHAWPGDFLGPAPLDNTIKLVRRAVGDNGRQQNIIQTFYGHGYQFVAHVEAGDDTHPLSALNGGSN